MIKNRAFVICFLLSRAAAAGAGEGQMLSGIVREGDTGRPARGALVILYGGHGGPVQVDSLGGFRLAVQSWPCSLTVHRAGFHARGLSVPAPVDTVPPLLLHPAPYSLGEILIEASPLEQTSAGSTLPVTMLGRRDMSSLGATTLAAALLPVEGVFVKDYGGSSGLKSISQRGLGSEHTAVLINGVPINSMQHGGVDLGTLTVADAERLEIVRGGGSTTVGNGAVGGVVNIIGRPAEREPALEVSSSLGSYSYQRFGIRGGGALGQVRLAATFAQERGKDNFDYVFHGGGSPQELSRTNSDFLWRTGVLRAALPAGNAAVVDAYAVLVSADRGVGGPVVSSTGTSRARQSDRDFLAQLGITGSVSESITYEVRSQARETSQRYTDPDIRVGGETLDNYYRNAEFRLDPRVGITSWRPLRLTAGGSVASLASRGNTLVGDVHRGHWATYATAEFDIPMGAAWLREAAVTAGIRHDAIDDLSSTTPSLGAIATAGPFRVGPVDGLLVSARMNAAGSFRAPTFNELYYAGGGGMGNPDLRPERARGVDGALRLDATAWAKWTVELTLFDMTMQDRIVWVAAGSGSVRPTNLRNVRSTGMELSGRLGLLDDRVVIRGTYARTDARKTSEEYEGDPTVGTALAYVPLETGGISATLSTTIEGGIVRTLSLMGRYAYTGYRYTTEDNVGFLPSYGVVDLVAGGGFPLGRTTLSTSLEIRNLLDEDYQVMLGYPMPLRSFRFTVGITY